MADNPYRSPESKAESDRPSPIPSRRVADVLFFGLGTLAGMTLTQEVALGILEVIFNRKIAPPGSLVPIFMLAACPLGLAVAFWIWQRPESKRARVIGLSLMLSPFLLWGAGITVLTLISWA